MITVINTNSSNLASVINAFRYVGAEVCIGSTPAEIKKATALVLPGVSAFANGIGNLEKANLVSAIKEKVQNTNTPIIGICLGMQLLTETSNEHGIHQGLGIIKGKVVKLEPTDEQYRVPNIGWYDAKPEKKSVLFPDTEAQSFYHVHSYYMECTDKEDIAATVNYSGRDITVAIERGNIFGVQFHPEKSQDAGLDLLQRFVKHTSQG